MARKKNTPTTFDAWLGKVIDDEASTHGGRAAIAGWIGVSEQSVNRRSRGEVPYLAREVEIVAQKVGVPTAELVNLALRRYGGMDRLLSEVAPTVTEEDNVTHLEAYRPPLDAAADDNPRTPPKD